MEPLLQSRILRLGFACALYLTLQSPSLRAAPGALGVLRQNPQRSQAPSPFLRLRTCSLNLAWLPDLTTRSNQTATLGEEAIAPSDSPTTTRRTIIAQRSLDGFAPGIIAQPRRGAKFDNKVKFTPASWRGGYCPLELSHFYVSLVSLFAHGLGDALAYCYAPPQFRMASR